MKLIFVHGWASGPFIWNDIRHDFKEYDCSFVNLGFFGNEDIDIPDGKFIGIGHSLGGLWLLKHYPEQMAGFISVASFNSFYPHVPKQILTAMKRNIVKDTKAQVKEFWEHAGLDQPGGLKQLKPLKLVDGLACLEKWKADVPTAIPFKVLASRDDPIVIEKMTMDIWGDYAIDWTKTGGHMLPLTQSDWCAHHIKRFVDAHS
jgi:pimeloyl-[acyl-carrier protein] methyl ester esterase